MPGENHLGADRGEGWALLFSEDGNRTIWRVSYPGENVTHCASAPEGNRDRLCACIGCSTSPVCRIPDRLFSL